LNEASVGIDVILGAISSTTRLKMLKLLSKKESGYSEIMDSLGMEKNKDAGKFSYHLKKLLDSRLIEVNKETGKYKISRIGLTVLEYLDKLEKTLGFKKILIVRRSENIVEPFDKAKIINSLVKEANVTPRLASEIASTVEEKLYNLRIEYLTAPLIRELVNTVLLDMGLEKYRHKLSRIGMPIYDVSKHLSRISSTGDPREFIEVSSRSIMREYCLQDFLNRNIAETYLMGRLDLYPLDNWLTGVIARSYQVPSDEEELLEVVTDVASSMMNIKHEINLRIMEARQVEATFRFLRYLLSKSFLRKRYFSITLTADEFVKNYARISELGKMIEEPSGKIRIVVVVQEPTYSELFKLDELARSLRFPYVVTNSNDSLYCGLRLPLEKASSDIHGFFSVNLISIVLESNRDIDYILKRIKELTSCGLSALNKRTSVFQQMYGKRYISEIYYSCSIWGLFEAVKIVYGVSPQISKESFSLFTDIIQCFIDSLKKYTGGKGRLYMSSRVPSSSARRMLRSVYHKLELDEIKNNSDYSYLMVPPMIKFRNIEERALLESRIASYFDGGHLSIVKGYRRRKVIEEAIVLFQHLEKTGIPFVIRFDEDQRG